MAWLTGSLASVPPHSLIGWQMRCVVACVLVGLAMANPEVEELRAQIRALSAQNAKLEAAVDAMKTLSPETKRQVAVELSAAKSCVATDPKASCELLADTGAPPAKPESNLGEPLRARIERAVQQGLGESLKPHTKRMIIKIVKAHVGSQCARALRKAATRRAAIAKEETSTQPAVSSNKDKGSGFEWRQCKSEVRCPIPCPPPRCVLRSPCRRCVFSPSTAAAAALHNTTGWI